jgi:glycosyltransferase involved in cell wall biosynthesis
MKKLWPAVNVAMLIIVVVINLHVIINCTETHDYLSKSPLHNLKKPLQDLLDEFDTTGFHYPMSNKYRTASQNHEFTKIPRIIHFVFGFQNSNSFGIVQYLSIASASVVHKDYLIYVHCPKIPTGFYWDMVSSVVLMNFIRDRNHSPENSAIKYVNEADVIRLRVLLRFGGVYMNLDIISLVSFDHLLDNDFVIGREKDIGLYNGMIMSTKHSKFLKIWYHAQKYASNSDPNYYSTILPGKLKNSVNFKDVTILKENSFLLRPLWNEEAFDYDVKGYLAMHLWNDAKELNMMWLLQNRSTLSSLLNVYIPRTLFSVIIPCYNQRKYIGSTIASVVHQTWQLWEIIVVDDGSPDKCGDYVKKNIAPYLNSNPSRKLLKVITTNGVGLASARNMAIDLATGIWICALDADDWIGKRYFERAEAAISADPNLNLIYSNQQFFEGSNWLWDVPDFETQKALTNGPLPVMSLYPRKLWQQVGGYSSVTMIEDYDFWLKLMETGLQSKKLDGAGSFSYYRYKEASRMRNSLNTSHIEIAMLRTRHASLYTIDAILIAQTVIGSMPIDMVHRLKKMSDKKAFGPDRAYVHFWLGLYEQHTGNITAAIAMYTISRAIKKSSLDWQANWHLGVALCRIDNNKAVELLEVSLVKYPTLALHRETKRTLDNCKEYGII